MASTATGVTATERGGNTFSGSFTADPASAAATGGIELVTATIPGLRTGDVVNVVPRTALTNGLIIAWVRVSADNTLVMALINATGGAIDQGSTVFDYGVIRGSTMALR